MIRRLLVAIALALPLAAAACGAEEDAAEGEPDVDGRYDLGLELTHDTPCPDFDIPDELAFTIVVADDGSLGIGSDMPDVLAIDGTYEVLDGATGLSIEVVRDWGTIDGVPISATVSHDLVVRRATVDGTAATSLFWDSEAGGTRCDYEWDVRGGRAE